MGGLRADEIVASVVGRSDHYIVRSEDLECVLQNRRRQVGAVAVECDDALVASCKMGKHRSEPRCEAFTLLRHHAYLLTRQACELVEIGTGAHNGDFHITQ